MGKATKEKSGKEKSGKEKKSKEVKAKREKTAKEKTTKESKSKELKGKEKKGKEKKGKEKNNKEKNGKEKSGKEKKGKEGKAKEKKGKEKANKAPCPPTVNPVSGKPCGSKTGPICQGYNLRCRKLKDLAACKASCLSDKRCDVAEWTPKSKHCCDSEIATKAKCPGEWSHRGDWTGYTICRGNSEEIKAKKVLGGKQSAKCEKKGKEKKSKEG